MIPPRFVPPGILQLYEVKGGERTLLEEFTASSSNRDRINRIRLDMLMVDPTRNLVLSENNAFNPPKNNVPR